MEDVGDNFLVKQKLEQMTLLKEENENLKANEQYHMQIYQNIQLPHLQIVTKFIAECFKVDDVEKLPDSVKTLLIESFTKMDCVDIAKLLSSMVTIITKQKDLLLEQRKTIKTMTEKITQYQTSNSMTIKLLRDSLFPNNNNNTAQQFPPIIQTEATSKGWILLLGCTLIIVMMAMIISWKNKYQFILL